MKYVSVIGFSGLFLDLASINVFKNYLSKLNGVYNIGNFKFTYPFFNNIQDNNNILFVNLNLRLADPLLNIRYRKAFLEGLNFYFVGSMSSFTYYVKHVSNSSFFLKQYLEGKT